MKTINFLLILVTFLLISCSTTEKCYNVVDTETNDLYTMCLDNVYEIPEIPYIPGEY